MNEEKESFCLTEGRKEISVKARVKGERTKTARGCREERDDQNIGEPPEKEREKTVMACFSGEEHQLKPHT